MSPSLKPRPTGGGSQRTPLLALFCFALLSFTLLRFAVLCFASLRCRLALPCLASLCFAMHRFPSFCLCIVLLLLCLALLSFACALRSASLCFASPRRFPRPCLYGPFSLLCFASVRDFAWRCFPGRPPKAPTYGQLVFFDLLCFAEPPWRALTGAPWVNQAGNTV